MTYIRVENFWEFQNADAWKKAAQAKKDSSRHPNWCKLVVRRDYEMDRLPLSTRLLYLELLRLATQHSNVIPNESEWIAKQISMRSQDVVKGLAQLRKGGWIKETRSARPTRNESETKVKPMSTDSQRTVNRKSKTHQHPANGLDIGITAEVSSRELLETFATRTRTRKRKEPSFLPTSTTDVDTAEDGKVGRTEIGNGQPRLPDIDSILRSVP
jgi:hypothetical protein